MRADAPLTPLTPGHMPRSFALSVAGLGGVERILAAPHGARRQSMRGFDETYRDIVDYIVRITHRISEEKDLGLIYETYATNAAIIDGSFSRIDRETMVERSIAEEGAYPDARYYADEVIWAGDDEVGFRTSHRVLTVGHDSGWSGFGPPTGRRFVVWSVADCIVRANEIVQEWVLDNTGDLVRQLGLDVRAVARATAATAPALPVPAGEVERLIGQSRPLRLRPVDPDGPFDPGAHLRWVLHTVWNWRGLSTVDAAYAAGVRWHGPTGRECHGRGEVKGFVLSMLTMFPDAVHAVDDLYWMGNDDEGYSVSVRWTLLGTHRGHGPYGPPTGRRAAFWGVSQFSIRSRHIVEEWTTFNEFEVLQHLLREEC